MQIKNKVFKFYCVGFCPFHFLGLCPVVFCTVGLCPGRFCTVGFCPVEYCLDTTEPILISSLYKCQCLYKFSCLFVSLRRQHPNYFYKCLVSGKWQETKWQMFYCARYPNQSIFVRHRHTVDQTISESLCLDVILNSKL